MNAPPRRPLTPVRTVVFDCDSTLTAVEGIDELAGEHRAAIAQLTDAAMRGEVPLEAVYGRRLELIRPCRDDLAGFGRRYVDALLPDAREVVRALHHEGIEVRIMSGGLRTAVLAVADALGVSHERVRAVDLTFDGDGAYAGFEESPLTRGGGKRQLMLEWRASMPGPVMLVGDGATDLEAYDVVDVFIAFAGVIERAHVTAAADAVIRARSLAPVLPLALGGARPRDTQYEQLYERGLALLDDGLRARLLQHMDG